MEVKTLIASIISGDVSSVKELLDREQALANEEWGYFTPIHYAVRSGNIDMVKLLLDAGADATYRMLGWQDSLVVKAEDRGYDRMAELLKHHLAADCRSTPEGGFICELIKQRRVEEALTALDRQPELIHMSDERSNTPIHWAVLTRQISLIDALLARGADLNASRPDGTTPLQLALTGGDYWYRANRDLHPDVMRNEWFLVGYLVSRGAHYDIWTASAIGDTFTVTELLKAEPALASRTNSVQRTALSYAAKKGYAATVRTLLDHGADPNAAERGAPRGTALWHAAAGNYADCVKLLLEHGADPNADVDSSGNPLFIAMRNGHEAIVKLLYAYGASLTLDQACCLGRLDIAAAMIQTNPALINQGGDYGPLCLAAGFHYPDIVRLLIRYGADLNAPWYANNFMGYAADAGMDMVSLLLDAGANPNNANWQGVTYLHLAAFAGNVEYAKLLIEAGADLHAVDQEYESTPLGWAVKYGKLEMVQLLLEAGTDPNAPGDNHWSRPAAWANRRYDERIAAVIGDARRR